VPAQLNDRQADNGRALAPELSAREIIAGLCALEEAPWADYRTLGSDIYHKGLPAGPFTPFTAMNNKGNLGFKPFTGVKGCGAKHSTK
jgi:hypothetical protein